MSALQRAAAVSAGVLLLACSVDAGPVESKAGANDYRLQAGERFTVVCEGSRMEYGFNGRDGIVGRCLLNDEAVQDDLSNDD